MNVQQTGLRRLTIALGLIYALRISYGLGAETDPLAAALRSAAERAAKSGIPSVSANPIHDAQVLAVAEKAFPNLVAELENAELLRKAALDPSMRGNLRGRIAESDWINRNAVEGWLAVDRKNAPQNDAWRRVNGKLEGAQIKVHNNWRNYISSMTKDNKAEYFVVPDDHYALICEELDTRRAGALAGGLSEKAAEYTAQRSRLVKLGRTFKQIDGAVESASKYFGPITKTLRTAGRAASYLGIALAVLDGGIAIHQVAEGKIEVDELVARLGKVIAGGASAWAMGELAAGAAVAAGATGLVPVAVAIVIGTATYLAVDWAVTSVMDSTKVGLLTGHDIARIWPEGARGVPLDRLYRKPPDPAVLIK